jgi:starch phosphorylase
MLDVQVKRIHEYKRQQLNLLHIVTQYARIRRGERSMAPRTFLFGGKAAPGYFMAKLIIRLVHGIAEVVDNDSAARSLMKVLFVPNFNVKTGQRIYPAADLSEQISTAGKEASGTGNMKLSMNGALTIGTLDGANVEIREEVGAENFFLFGLTAEEVRIKKSSGYRARDYLERDQELAEAIELISSGHFSKGDRSMFQPLVDSMVGWDEYLVMADYRPYLDAQARVSAAWKDTETWTKKSILNAARMGKFSSDRSIAEYAKTVWQTKPVEVGKKR